MTERLKPRAPRVGAAFRPSVEWFAERFRYDPDTGCIFSVASGREVGSRGPAGRRAVAYRHPNGRGSILAARLAWALYTGDWPQGAISFADGDADNAAWENMSVERLVGQKRGPARVFPNRNYYRVPVYVEGRRTTRGFKSRASAIAFADAVRAAIVNGGVAPDADDFREGAAGERDAAVKGA